MGEHRHLWDRESHFDYHLTPPMLYDVLGGHIAGIDYPKMTICIMILDLYHYYET